ncbi:MAG TPA: O-antigen ligase family protein [Candidatus Paceibacterota bacterium]|nr:O-antigen ligase family protein [Candidatus Paceibacterota bacterium]
MSYTAYLRGALLTGLLAIPFIPFIIAGSWGVPAMYFPYITGKNFAFRILVEILVALYIVLALKEPAYRPKSSWILWAAGAFALWIAAATVLSVDPVKSFWSNFERMDGYITVLHLMALFVVAGAVLNTQRLWNWFFRASIVAGAIQGAYALLQVFHLFGMAPSSQSGVRADTTFGNATYLAVFMLFTIFLTLLMMVRDRKSLNLVSFYGLALLLELPALYLTETRGALLGLVGGFIIAAGYIAWRAREGQYALLRKGAFAGLGVVVLLIAGFLALKDTSFVRNSPGLGRLASISLEDSTTKARLFYIWPMAAQGALEKPITGWGQENFSYIFNEHYNPTMWSQEQWFDRAHNEFLDWFVAGGIPALVLYASFFALAAWALLRSAALSAPEQGVLLGLLAGYAFNNLFVFDNLISIAYFFLLLAFCHTLSRKELPRFMVWLKPAHDHTVAIVAPIAVVLVLGLGWYFNADALARAQVMIDALQPTDAAGAARPPEKQLAAYKLALQGGELGRQETTEQLLQFANAQGASSSASPALKQEAFAAAKAAGDAMIAQRKNDARLEFFSGLFYAQFGQYDDALAHLNKAIDLSPGKQQILFTLGQAYLQKGDNAKGVAAFKQAFDSAPDYDQARMAYAGALYYLGQTAQGDALLKERFGTTIVDNDQLIQIYQSVKLYDRVVAIWEERVKNNPDDMNTHLQLASAYFSAGQSAKTIEELQKVAKLNPSAAAQVQSLISQIQSGTLKAGQQ